MDSLLTRRRNLWSSIATTLVTAAVFYQVCTYDFINYDNQKDVHDNPAWFLAASKKKKYQSY